MTIHKLGQPKVHLINDYLLFSDKWQFVPGITKKKIKNLLTWAIQYLQMISLMFEIKVEPFI
jgi:hypothetical protein